MINKPLLRKASIVKTIDYDSLSGLSDAVIKALKAGRGAKEINSSEFGINSIFTLKEYEHAYGSDGFNCEGTKAWISVYKLSSGANHLNAFEDEGCEKSEDYDNLPSSKILHIPTNHEQAIELIEEKYIGKKLRVVARSADGSNPYGGRYYLFAIE